MYDMKLILSCTLTFAESNSLLDYDLNLEKMF